MTAKVFISYKTVVAEDLCGQNLLLLTSFLLRELLKYLRESYQKKANNGLRGMLPGGGATLEMCVIVYAMQCVLYTHEALYLGVGVKQAESLVGEDLCEVCKQSNETNHWE